MVTQQNGQSIPGAQGKHSIVLLPTIQTQESDFGLLVCLNPHVKHPRLPGEVEYWPTGQDTQPTLPAYSPYVPFGHMIQLPSPSLLYMPPPYCPLYCPTRQGWHLFQKFDISYPLNLSQKFDISYPLNLSQKFDISYPLNLNKKFNISYPLNLSQK